MQGRRAALALGLAATAALVLSRAARAWIPLLPIARGPANRGLPAPGGSGAGRGPPRPGTAGSGRARATRLTPSTRCGSRPAVCAAC